MGGKACFGSVSEGVAHDGKERLDGIVLYSWELVGEIFMPWLGQEPERTNPEVRLKYIL